MNVMKDARRLSARRVAERGVRLLAVVGLLAAVVAGCGDDDPKTMVTSNNGTNNATNNGTNNPTNNGPNNGTNNDPNNGTNNSNNGTNNDACGVGGTSCLDQGGIPDLSLCQPGWQCTQGCCVEPFRCADDATCAARSGMDNNCKDGRFDCQCNEGTGACFTFICTVDADCSGGQLCADGACVEAPVTGLVARILTPGRVLVQGEELALQIVAYDPAEPSATVTDGVTFDVTTSDAQVIALGTGTAVLGAGMSGQATITAKVTGNANDPGDTLVLTNVAAPAADLVRVSALDANTRRPIEGATVVLHAETPLTATTDAEGAATFADAGAGPYTVTVMAAGYGYMTLAGTASDDVLVPLSQLVNTEVGLNEETRELVFDQLENVDIVSGTADFTHALNLGEIEVALAGFGIGAGLLDLNFELIIGPNIPQYFPANNLGLPTNSPTDIPGGVVLNLNRRALVENYNLIGREGEQILWSLGGRISLIENPNLVTQIIGAVGGNFNVGTIVAAVLPFFRNFYSGLRTDVVLESQPTLPLRSDVDVQLKVPTGIEVGMNPPVMPQANGQYLEGIVVLGGALVDGRGFVPLGITAALDTTDDSTAADGIVDGDPGVNGDQPVSMRMSPLHSGLLGPNTRYAVVTVALRFDTSGGLGEATSVMISRVAPGMAIPAQATLPRADFLPFGEDSTWGDANDGANRGLHVASVAGADVMRTVFDGEGGSQWVVWSSTALADVVLPNPADFGLVDPSARRKVRVQAVDLEDGVDFDGLTAAGGRNLTDIIDVAEAFSLIEIP